MYIIRGPGNLTYVLCDTTFFLELWFWEVFLTGWWPCTSRTICSLQLSMVWMVSLAGGHWQEPGRNIPPLLHRTQTCNRQPGLRTKDKKILKISIRSSLIDVLQRIWKKSLIEKDFDTQSSTVQPRCSRHRLDSPGTCNHIIAAIISVLLSSFGVILQTNNYHHDSPFFQNKLNLDPEMSTKSQRSIFMQLSKFHFESYYKWWANGIQRNFKSTNLMVWTTHDKRHKQLNTNHNPRCPCFTQPRVIMGTLPLAMVYHLWKKADWASPSCQMTLVVVASQLFRMALLPKSERREKVVLASVSCVIVGDAWSIIDVSPLLSK